ncbi:hypothetical protein ACJIZ3_021657 [Penstemon smallii]|uniref:Myb-like domain-containing protein n=1 Tax=Penstemon smallii TaxID=265156 RepID=A0ABD3SN09_9LAMI
MSNLSDNEKECGFTNNRVNKKRKRRNQFEKDCEIVLGGWTEEQESALNLAYVTAKPTPSFWKKVAKLVPGKSAEECFERIQSDHSTPPQRRSRSRARTKSSPLTLSATKLFTSSTNTKNKRLSSSKRSRLLAQKTVRQLLQKQHNENQDYEPDFFSDLEPTIEVGPSVLTRCEELSSSGLKTGKSRLYSSSNNVASISPPVLKKIKNKALHEKYIDKLHNRDVKRKAEALRQGKCSRAKNEKNASDLKVESVKVAKDALIFEAQDAINKFRRMQLSIRNDISDVDDNDSPSDEDEGEDEL